MIFQHAYPLKGPPWAPAGPPDLTGYVPVDHADPVMAAEDGKDGKPNVVIIGTVRNELKALQRSMEIWRRQRIPHWLLPEYVVVDEGSTDGVREWCRARIAGGDPMRYIRTREPGEEPERSCTLAFNAMLKRYADVPLVIFQWWDRIPGSFSHLLHLVEPHRTMRNVAVSATSRHIGGSSSMEVMTEDRLETMLSAVAWQIDPTMLGVIAGTIGSHCRPGQATESSGLCISPADLIAIGGWDERYITRSSYVNVDLWRRLIELGVTVVFPDEPHGANYHQSHPSPGNREKELGWMTDPRIRRNMDREWGMIPILEVM